MLGVSHIHFLFAVLGLALVAGTASADPINIRPINTDLSDLKDGFDTIATDGEYGIDMVDDQLSAAHFSITGNGLGSASLVPAIMGEMPVDSLFGFYKFDDPDKRLTLFDSDEDIQQVQFQFKDLNKDGTIDVRVYEPGEAAFDTENDFGVRFGFFLTIGDETWFSEDSLNDDSPQMLIYPSNDEEDVDLGIDGVLSGPDPAHYYVAVEESWVLDKDLDFTDVVVQFESITPIPEPGSMILVLAGLSGAAIARRRRKRKSS